MELYLRSPTELNGEQTDKFTLLYFTYFSWRDSPWWTRASSFSRLHDHTQDTPHSVGLLWMSDRPVAETST